MLQTVKILFVMFLGLLMFAGCEKSTDESGQDRQKTTGEQVKKEAEEALDTAGEYLADRKGTFMKSMEKNLNELESKINELKTKAQQRGEEAKSEYSQYQQQLEKQLEETRSKYQELSQKSGEAWTELKQGLEKAYQDLQDAYAKAEKELTSTENQK